MDETPPEGPVPAPRASGPPAGPRPAIRCRAIEAADVPAVVALLAAAFPYRPAAYWERGFARLAARVPPEGAPRFGLLLDRGGAPVGVLLTLYSAPGGPGAALRCNLSSWFVLPEYRALGTVLDGQAMRDRGVTYLNLSPAAHTVAMHEARGFRRYCRGQMVVVPLLSRSGGRAVRAAAAEGDPDVPDALRDLVRDHAAYGCLCLVGRGKEGAAVVILQRLSLKLSRRWPAPRLPAVQMVYGPAGEALAPWLGAIGRHLLRRRLPPVLLVDADGPVPGAVGRYLDGWRPRYARGPGPVAVGDLSYSEIAVFGP